MTQSASLDTGSSQGFFFKLHEDSGDSPPKTELAQKLPNQTGLLKVRANVSFVTIHYSEVYYFAIYLSFVRVANVQQMLTVEIFCKLKKIAYLHVNYKDYWSQHPIILDFIAIIVLS